MVTLLGDHDCSAMGMLLLVMATTMVVTTAAHQVNLVKTAIVMSFGTYSIRNGYDVGNDSCECGHCDKCQKAKKRE